MIDPERIQRLAAKMGDRKDALEIVHQMRCGGKKFDEGGDKDAAYIYKPKNAEIPAEVIPLGSPYSLAKYRVYDDGAVYIPGLSRVDQDIKDGAYWMYGPIASKKTYLRNKDNGEYFEYDPDINPSLNLSGYDKVGYDEIKPMLPRRDYIGGNNYRLNTVKRVPGLLDMIKRKADSYGLEPNLLLHRFMKEGIVDYWVNRYNTENAVDQNDSFFKNLLNEEVDGFNGLGLDDAGSNLIAGKYTLKDPSATWQERTARNEEGRDVVSVVSPDMNSALEIKAAEMAYRQRELAKRGLTGNAYVNAAYNMGLYHDKLNDPDYVSRNYTVPDYHVFDSGGKFFRTNLQNEFPMMYTPMKPWMPDVSVPMRFIPEPNLGDYVPPSTTGMAESYPITVSAPSVRPDIGFVAPEVVEDVVDLFSDEAKARRLLRQRYAESVFDDKAVSNAGARGAWQIMPITYKDYLTRGRGKEGDLDDPNYNRLVRDHTFRMIPRDLEEIWDDNYSDRNKLALLYAGYNRGANGLKKYLRGLVKKGVDISKPENWVEGMNPETRNYVHFLAYDEDVPGTYLMNEKFEKAARSRGYMASGGKIHIKPENRGKFTALKKRTGHSASWFKAHGTPAQKKMAVFALNSRKWKHGDGGTLDNYFYDGGPYGVTPLGVDYLTYLQTIPEVSGGAIEPSVAIASLPAKFNGSQSVAARYAEGYQKGAKPVSEAISRAGQDIFNTVDTVVGLTPTPAGALTWLGHMGADAVEGRWGRVGRDVALAAALGTGARGIGWLKNYVDDATNYGEDLFRAFTDRVPAGVSTNFAYAAPATRAAVEAVPAVTNAASAPYEIADLGGGYMLKSLMRGNPLEKQISKNGTVNVNNVRALVGKGSKVEQAVVDKVLASEDFTGKKSIDYNKFRKAVQDELIPYERSSAPGLDYEDYGMDRIGFHVEQDPAGGSIPGVPEGATPRVLLFDSPRIPNGSGKHYFDNTLGHSRIYTTADEPDVLHVMESQSDWAQGNPKIYDRQFLVDNTKEIIDKDISELNTLKSRFKEKYGIEAPGFDSRYSGFLKGWSPEQFDDYTTIDKLRYNLERNKEELPRAMSEVSNELQKQHIVNNYTSRQIQENLRYAAEKGQTKMRYPTRDTAAKIEGYGRGEAYFNNKGEDITTSGESFYELPREHQNKYDELEGKIRSMLKTDEPNGSVAYNSDGVTYWHTPETLEKVGKLDMQKNELLQNESILKPGITKKDVFTANGDYKTAETILQKYDAFPKQFKKLYKNADVRVVTDPKGNTWYEVDVPENYLQQEWAYEEGGSMILPKMMMDKHSPDKLRKAIANIKAKRMQ